MTRHTVSARSRTGRIVVAAAIVGAALAPAGSVDARPDSAPGVRAVRFDLTRTIVGGDAECDPTQPSRCGFTFRNVLAVSGDLSGTGYSVGSAVLLPNGDYQGTAVIEFEGSVSGCGTGTLVLVETGVVSRGISAGSGTWEIVGGTGDLAQARGEGTSAEEFAGTVRCH